MFKLMIIPFALLLTACQSTSRQIVSSSYEFAVPAGEKRLISYSYGLNPDCSSQVRPTVRILQLPTHGQINVVDGFNYPAFLKSDPRYECRKKLVASRQVWYQPDPRYTGSDTVKIESIHPNGFRNDRTVNVSVR